MNTAASDEPKTAGILTLAGPLVISFWVRASFQLVDSIYAGQLPGRSEALTGAITLTVPIEFLMIACWVGASNGLTARLAAAMGAREGAKIEQLERATLRIIQVLCGVFLLLAAALWFLAPVLIADAEMAANFRLYAPLLTAGSGITAFWSILPDSIVKAHHDTKSTMWAGLISGFTNVGLNSLFVFVFHWGMVGIALSTVIGRVAGLVYALRRADYHERRRIEARRDSEPGVFERPLRAILVLSVPAAISFLLMSAESSVMNYWVMQDFWKGRGLADVEAAVAAWGQFDQLTRFMAMPIIAAGVALLPLTARLWGRGERPRIARELRTALLASGVYVAALALPVGFLIGPLWAALLNYEDRAFDFTVLGMQWMPLAVLAMAPTFLLRSCFEGMQRPLPGLRAALLRSLVLTIPLSLLGIWLAPRFGYPAIGGAYAGFTLGVGIASVVLAGWMRTALARDAAEDAARAGA